ncbi:MAG: hypothetical protein WAW12_06410 [Pseudomonas sp.]|jgi:hypothetical protein
MSLQALYAVITAHPGRCLNLLALFFACAGAWLLLATRQRELRAEAQVHGPSAGHGEAVLDAEPTLRLNRFFYQFGFACLAIALLLSWDSTRL